AEERGDFWVDEKSRTAVLTEQGIAKVERMLGVANLYDPGHIDTLHHVNQALKAHAIYQRDVDYIVKDGQVIIVDEFTGRLMHGRRWSDGLHQAVEAKEGVKIQRESVTYATITLQNYFRLYKKLAGMTGTAWTEREEFNTIYDLDVIVVPTHHPMIREDESDIIFRTAPGKYRAVVDEIEEMHAQGRPSLVGTVSIENSELLADGLKRFSTCRLADCGDHYKVCPLKEPQVLNAKHHEREAAIIAQAGSYGAVTIATNMAGRGTDIILGGNPERLAEELGRQRGIELVSAEPEQAAAIRQEARLEWQTEHERVVAAGGLHIIGTERHEARRIDNQLRGRSGRQGDPGSSRFFVSFDDDVMRRFAPDWVPNLLARMGMEEDTPLESGMVSKSIEQAQTKVEGYNFDIRKHVVQYDDVMNRHRDLIYTERRKILEGADLRANTLEMVQEEIESVFDAFAPGENSEEWDIRSILAELKAILPLPVRFSEEYLHSLDRESAIQELRQAAEDGYESKEKELGADKMRVLERLVMLGTIDRLWVYHLTALEEMREGIGLTGYGGRDPLVEFKREAHDMYEQLKEHIRQNVARRIFHVTLTPQAVPTPAVPRNVQESGPAKETPTPTRGAARAAAAGRAVALGAPAATANQKVGRNDPCPCGSGRKYNKCHGSGLAA
ncbi:MAG TPA: SEC-C metal-binding domain-containing protein, partial [Dehalococcoidia bacterium]|nr:SEC-C metal-binding domain-containing protein [Dehalococcoidia bacterium]